jgi:MoaA/NifB/PqqE/SkfB family radical SAM enzyme
MTGGETLVRKDSIGLARYASKLGFWVEFLTNGSLMTREGAEQLIRSGVRRIKISLDGSKAEIHDAVRGRDGFFEKAREALEVLALKKSRYGANTQIWGKTTVMNLNAEDLPAIVALARALKIDGVEFQALEPTYYSEQLRNPHWHEENPLWVKDLPKLSESLRQVKELKRQGYSVLNTLENLEMIENYFYDPQGVSYKVHSHDYRKKEPRCTAWPGGLQISPEGGMRMCHWMEPFAWSRDGDFKTAWRKRDRCWKKDCSYIHPIALKEGKLDERDRQENPLHLRGGAGKHGHTRTNR